MTIKDRVYNFKTKHKEGFTEGEILELLKEFPSVDLKKFNKALSHDTYSVIYGESIRYPSDIEKALKFSTKLVTTEELLVLRPKAIKKAIETEFSYLTKKDRKRLYDKANYYALILENNPAQKQNCVAAMKHSIRVLLYDPEYSPTT